MGVCIHQTLSSLRDDKVNYLHIVIVIMLMMLIKMLKLVMKILMMMVMMIVMILLLKMTLINMIFTKVVPPARAALVPLVQSSANST